MAAPKRTTGLASCASYSSSIFPAPCCSRSGAHTSHPAAASRGPWRRRLHHGRPGPPGPETLSRACLREAQAARSPVSDRKFLPPAFKAEGVHVRLGLIYTVFATIALTRTPTAADQTTLARALEQVETSYPFSPSGVLLTIAYGIPYFQRLPGGMPGALVAEHMPRLISEPQRYVLQEAVPGPRSISPRSTKCPPKTSASSASSQPPGARTSSCRAAAIAHSRSSS
jgi:hypothetical protein